MPLLPVRTSNFALLHTGVNCRRKDTLHEYQVEPAPELESHLVEMADAGESKAAMQADRDGIVGVDSGNHDMLGGGGGARQELDYQRPTDALAAAVRSHVDAVLDAVTIARPRPEFTERAEPDDARCVPRHDHGKAVLPFRIEPGFAACRRKLLFRIDRGRIANDFVVDRQNLRKIVAGGVVYQGRHGRLNPEVHREAAPSLPMRAFSISSHSRSSPAPGPSQRHSLD